MGCSFRVSFQHSLSAKKTGTQRTGHYHQFHPRFSSSVMLNPYLFCLFLVGLLPALASGQYRGRPCSLGKLPIVLLAKNPETGNFTVVKRFDADEKDLLDEGQFRLLQETDLESSFPGNLRGQAGASSLPGLLAEDQNVEDMRRSLLLEDHVFFHGNSAFDSGNMTDLELYYARECSCFEPDLDTVYCPFATSTCQAPYSSNPIQIPGCLNQEPPSIERCQTIFLVVVIWLLIWFFCVLGTDFGRSSIDYIISFCIPGWNRFVASRMLRRNPDKALGLIRNNLRNRGRMLERRSEHALAQMEGENVAEAIARREGGKQPTSLALRTRILKSNKQQQHGHAKHGCGSHSIITVEEQEEGSSPRRVSFSLSPHSDHGGCEDQEDENCAICLAPLLDGDRVGALSCNHILHAECLKTWLPRRNVCPLCQVQDAATPRFENNDNSSTDHISNASGHEDLVQSAESP
jgi:hypothetical protein